MSKCTDKKLGALLHAYELDALSIDDAKKFEFHLIKCDHCFHELEDFRKQAAMLSSDSRVKKTVVAFTSELKKSESSGRKIWEYLWPKAPVVFRPLVLMICMLLLAIPYVIDMQPSVDFEQTQKITLLSDRSVNDSVINLSGPDPAIINFYFPEAVQGMNYTIQLIDLSDNSVISENSYFWNMKTYTGTVYLPLKGKHPGLYRLDLIDTQSDQTPNIKSFEFEIAE